MTHSAENGLRATGAIVPERQRCICPEGLCLDHCRACNHSGRDLEEPCIADPEWEPDDDDLARREGRVFPPAEKCWRHDYNHREYVCRCSPPVVGDTGMEDEPRPIPPAECDNYRSPLTCLTAPSSETGRCDKCRPIPPGSPSPRGGRTVAETSLLTSCALPGCTTLVAAPGEVCDGCRHAFGPMLVETTRPARSPEVVAAALDQRDREVLAAYQDQTRTSTEPVVKSNQVCWLCTERRKCTQVAGRWECSDCISVDGTGAADAPGTEGVKDRA